MVVIISPLRGWWVVVLLFFYNHISPSGFFKQKMEQYNNV